jgi:hypothetical protein
MTETLTALEGGHVPDVAPAMMPPGALRSAAAMATDGAPACAELKGTS